VASRHAGTDVSAASRGALSTSLMLLQKYSMVVVNTKKHVWGYLVTYIAIAPLGILLAWPRTIRLISETISKKTA
jgi:hypothetical protein